MNLAVKAKLKNQFLPLVGALEAGGGAVATLFEPCVEVLGQWTSNTLVIFIKVCGRGTGETCARI